MPVFDTSALLPLFIEGHPNRDKAKKAFNSAETIVLHPAVITEFTIVLRRLTKDRGMGGNEEVRKALISLLKEPQVTIRSDMDHHTAMDLYLIRPGLSFADAVVARSSAYFDKQEPVTFDKQIVAASRIPKEELERRREALEAKHGLDERDKGLRLQ